MGVEQEVAAKQARVRSFLDEAGYDALVLTTQANFAWITGGGDNHVVLAADAGVASVLVTREAKYVVANNIESPRIMTEEIAAPVLQAMRDHPLGREAEIIGTVVEDHPGKVVMRSVVGGTRIVDMMSGDPLPRIC